MGIKWLAGEKGGEKEARKGRGGQWRAVGSFPLPFLPPRRIIHKILGEWVYVAALRSWAEGIKRCMAETSGGAFQTLSI